MAKKQTGKKTTTVIKYKVKEAIMDDPEQLRLIGLMVKNSLQMNLVEEAWYDDGTESATIQIHFNKKDVVSK